MREYRIVKQTKRSGRLNFKIEVRGSTEINKHQWFEVTGRPTLELAKYAIEFMRGEEVIGEEVVE